MCDCYSHQCSIESCKRRLDWHIADFNYPREDFKMWCPKHLSKAPAYAVYYQVATEGEWIYSKGQMYSTPEKFEIWAVEGPKIGDTTNCPNLGLGGYRIITGSDVNYLLDWIKRFRKGR